MDSLMMKNRDKPIINEIFRGENGGCFPPYPTLSRRKFLIKSSILAGTSAFLVLPATLKAGLIYEPDASNEYEHRLAIYRNGIGFNGERRDIVTGLYHLGHGYRAYNPVLMRFHATDSMSPFGRGGLNVYSYCLGDPVNLVDPTGHMSWQAGLGIGLGILGLLVSIFTLGAGIAAGVSLATAGAAVSTASVVTTGLGITSSVLGVASASTGIASSALEESNPQLAADLGWSSLGLGIGSALTGIGSAVASTKVVTKPFSPTRQSLHTINNKGQNSGRINAGKTWVINKSTHSSLSSSIPQSQRHWGSARIPMGLDTPTVRSQPIRPSIGRALYGKDSSFAKPRYDLVDGAWANTKGTLRGTDEQFFAFVKAGGAPELFGNKLKLYKF